MDNLARIRYLCRLWRRAVHEEAIGHRNPMAVRGPIDDRNAVLPRKTCHHFRGASAVEEHRLIGSMRQQVTSRLGMSKPHTLYRVSAPSIEDDQSSMFSI